MGRANGYSLLELVVVLGVTALLAFVAAPAVGGWIDGATLRSDARTAMNEIRRLREQALDRQTEIAVAVSAGAPHVLAASNGDAISLSQGTSATSTGLAVAWDGTVAGHLALRRGGTTLVVSADPLTGRLTVEGVR